MKKKVLVIEPHSDDGLISIGGFLEKNKDNFEYFFLLCLSSDLQLNHAFIEKNKRDEEFSNYVNYYGGKWIKGKYGDITFPLDQDGNLDVFPKRKLINGIENVIQTIKPDILFIQGPSFHQDHTAIYEASIAALRPTLPFYPLEIYTMENPTYVHSSGVSTDFSPNTYIELSEEELEKKLEIFSTVFPSQLRPSGNCLSTEGIKAWARYRGIEARCKFAEALYCFSRKI